MRTFFPSKFKELWCGIPLTQHSECDCSASWVDFICTVVEAIEWKQQNNQETLPNLVL